MGMLGSVVVLVEAVPTGITTAPVVPACRLLTVGAARSVLCSRVVRANWCAAACRRRMPEKKASLHEVFSGVGICKPVVLRGRMLYSFI